MSKNLEFIQVTLKSWQSLNKPPLKRGVFGIMVIGVFLLSLGINFQPADAQRISSDDAWQQVYQQLPDLPRENQYVSKETGKLAENNTLLSRMIWYHSYLKGRAPNYRLDWKLTLADYLGANEVMYETTYPGKDTLQKNPFDGDRAAVARLNRRQRDALVQALVNVFSSKSQNTPATPNTSSPSQETTPTPRQVPKKGGAQLLK
ncbi:hypothetical protein SAMD00079811_41910 [Scytonema sp. HK-05]|uniref:hypothetical protein n=1 Tax=Scytonema sp. HK-05 TaxID=1137095 RepID=UPI00093721D7|nr:hypothetical protein [Scytonema sp. HK-05]OKH50426.1 hypothetical protein NIES2130_34220 [Scytonema sp. HK-05]BAY46579.1 hypothetical protein SAMD00079811_41910 [Scytonema sp. HK-05]